MGGFAGFVQGLNKAIQPKLDAARRQREQRDAESRQFWMKVAMTPGLPDDVMTQAQKELKRLYPDKESQGLIGKVSGVIHKIHGARQQAQQGGQQQQASPAGAVPPMQNGGGQGGSPQALGQQQNGGAPQPQAQGQQSAPQQGAFRPVPPMGGGGGMAQAAQAMGQAQRSNDIADAATIEKLRTDSAEAQTKAREDARAELETLKAKQRSDLEETRAKHEKELAETKNASAKEREETAAKHKQELAEQKAKHDNELTELRAKLKPPGKTSAKAINEVPSMAEAKKAVPGTDLPAWDFILSGKFDVRGLGKEATTGAEAIKSRAQEIMKKLGLTEGDVMALRTEYKGESGAFARVAAYDAMIGSFEGTLQRNAIIAQKLSEEFKRGDPQLYNRVIAAWKTKIAGDPEANDLAGQLHGLAGEWAKVVSGSTGARGAGEQDIKAAEARLYEALSSRQLDSFIQNVIVPDAKNRSDANRYTKQQLLSKIRGLPTGQKDAPVPPPGGGSGGEGKVKVWNEKTGKFE